MSSPPALDDPITVLTGVGARTAEAFAEELGISTVHDLLHHWPRAHRDTGDLATLHETAVGEQVTLVGTIVDWSSRHAQRNRRLQLTTGTVSTESGRFRVVFFNQQWISRQHPVGATAAFSGKLDTYGHDLQLANPDVTRLDDPDDLNRLLAERIQPVYPATEALPHHTVARTIRRALEELPALEEWVDAVTLARTGLLSFDEAVREMHAPSGEQRLAAAVERLKFDELYTLQLGLRWRRARLEADRLGIDNSPVEGGLADRYVSGLPFEPTGAQWTALSEIREDLASTARPMHRLLQGDVGSGKTLVAVWTMLNAVDNGRQAAMMVPTEVLADQHMRMLLDHLDPLGVNMFDGPRVELLTGSTTATEQRRILGGLLSGEVDVVVGTHALLEPGVRFADLGVVVIDEQHRFGVDQRAALRQKRDELPGAPSIVDVLVMTATPIPRSLAWTIYGELDVTVLDELPPGRRPIITQLITPLERERRAALEGFVRDRALLQEQTYWVCPLVDPSDKLDALAATEAYERLRTGPFRDLRVGLVHGQLPTADKDAAMRRFRDGELDVLVATTVIEVGVDVPSATVMVIEDAERFGISQLHQLRGRVGRGGDQSYCVLFAGWRGDLTDDAVERLEAVARTTDGFELAERDLELRGSGHLLGTRQAGAQDLRLASTADLDLIVASRRAASLTIEEDPDLAANPLLAEQVRRRHRGLEGFAALEAG